MQAKSQGLILSILLQILLLDLEYPSGLCFFSLAQWNPGQWGVTKKMALLADLLLPALNVVKASSLRGLWTLQDSQGPHWTCWEVHKDDCFHYQVLELWYPLKWLYSGNL